MFRFLKEKLKSIFKKTKSELEQAARSEQLKLKAEVKEAKAEEKPKALARLKRLFSYTRLSASQFEKFFEQLESALIEANVALPVIDRLKEKLSTELVGKELKRKQLEEELKAALRRSLLDLLPEPFDLEAKIKEKTAKEKPYVIVFFGINGVGKTLTIAKLAWLLKQKGLSCVLAASDTFRAAAIEQLEKLASQLELPLVKHKYGSDPAAVAFDAVAHARARGIDVVLIDTAGRIHAKADLMREMEKICRVSRADLKIFVGEAIAGADALEQARAFNEAVGIDASILTKADVDEKGGACISIAFITRKPILWLGIGQNFSDLKPFEREEFVKVLLG